MGRNLQFADRGHYKGRPLAAPLSLVPTPNIKPIKDPQCVACVRLLASLLRIRPPPWLQEKCMSHSPLIKLGHKSRAVH